MNNKILEQKLKYIEDMNMDDLFDLIRLHSISSQSLATNINNIIINIDVSKGGQELNDIWNEYCNKRNICSACGCELQNELIEEYSDDYPVYIKKCINCG